MADTEIIKALECCVSEQYTCEKCPYQEIKHYDNDNGFEIMPNGKQYDDWSCERWLNTDLLDLINRQKAEIENLKIELQAMRNAANGYKKEVEKLKKGINIELENFASEYDAKIKAEAVKEFAGELERSLINMPQKDINYSNLVEHIENLVKRKGGEK